ncbi:acyltransferase family protein [Stenotrophomonas chelatiphaga]|uniref:acyltransferase family protein n=1 Tax=Stenotrophomonas chelatiphaga TaxID=517011 RepID=UPI00289F79BF|nr:acyltransferase family protein [Stenotrophomonas chelatiphaga]
MSTQKYRPEIDGIRSLAIIPVLLYHAGVAGFSGGFVGVDVFFVISGYLITSILVREFSEGTYSIASFYERRIRRIFPALIVVLGFVIIVSPASLLPSEFTTLGRDAISSVFFVANINFWMQSGYFAADAEAKPLLHMWSLGVEEQFYLVAPLALYLILRFAPNRKLTLVGIAALVSLAGCIYLTPRFPGASFYLLPTRAWELLVGSWLAIYGSQFNIHANNQRTMTREAAGMFGLALVIAPVLTYTRETAFPGYAAIAPVIGAALLILSGSQTLTGRLLSLKPLVKIGLISYSLYLWHWPLIVFFKNAGWLPSGVGTASVIALSVLLAWLTWRFIESPTRNRIVFSPKRLGCICAAASITLVLTSAVFISLDGWNSRFSSKVVAYDEDRNDVSPDRDRCHFAGGSPPLDAACVLGPDKVPSVAVWGDSHGVELAKAVGEAGVPVLQLTYSSCPPALNATIREDRPACAKHNEEVLEELSESSSIDTVILTSYYDFPVSRSGELQAGLAETAKELDEAGKKVIVIGPYPALSGRDDVPTYLARGGRVRASINLAGVREFESRMSARASVLMPTKLFCQGSICNLAPGGSALLFDAHHPSMHAARIVASRLVPLIKVRR